MATDSQFTPVVARLACLRGISTLTGFCLAVEIGVWDRFTGSSDLCVVDPPGAGAGGGQEDAESVVVEGPEAVGQAAGLLDDQVDGLGAAVADAVGLEVGQDLGAPGS